MRRLLLLLLLCSFPAAAQLPLGPGDTISRRVARGLPGPPAPQYRTYYDVFVGQIPIGHVGSTLAGWLASTLKDSVLSPVYPTATAAQRRLVLEAQKGPVSKVDTLYAFWDCWHVPGSSSCLNKAQVTAVISSGVVYRDRVVTRQTAKIVPDDSTFRVAPGALAPLIAIGTAGQVDTLIWQSDLNATKDSLVFRGPFRYSPIFGPSIPPPFPLPPGPVRVRVDTVKVIIVVHDTLPTPRPGAPELPRGAAAMDSMVATSRAIDHLPAPADTLFQAHPAGALPYAYCRGPGCNTPAMIQRVKDYTATLQRPQARRKVPKYTPPKKEPVG